VTLPALSSDQSLSKAVEPFLSQLNLLNDKKFRSEFKNITDFLKKKNIALSPTHIKEFIEESVKNELLKIAQTQYLYMEKKDDFTEAGEQRVAISFCRLLLEIPPSREVTQVDANLFREKMSQFGEKMGSPSVHKLDLMLKNAKIKILNFEFDQSDDDEINELLAFVGSDLNLFYASQAGLNTSLFGKNVEIKEISGKFREHKVYLNEKEVARMPVSILSMAANSYPKGTIIRKESCETIFYNKWYSYFETSDFEKDLLLSHDYSNIRESIKVKAFEAYQIKNKAEIESKKNLFVDEMVEGIVWHELGHRISLDEGLYIPSKISAIGSSLSVYGTSALNVLKEALADWAPEVESACGPIWHFVKLAKTDYQKAKRMIYVYLSDYWFLDFGEEFMGETTDIIVPLITQFMDEKGEINFSKIESVHSKIFEFIVKNYKLASEEVLNVYQKAKYQLTSQQEINFEVLEKEMLKLYRKDPGYANVALEEIQKFSTFWVNVKGYLQKFSKADFPKIDAALKAHTTKFNLELLNRLTNNKADQYANSIRKYVIERMKYIQCYQSESVMTEEELLDNGMNDLKFSDEIKSKVLQKLNAIKNNKEKVDVAINYDAKPHPFIALIQKMMVDSDCGEIKSGMSLGENLSEELPEAQKIQELHKLIAGVKKQISEKMYEKIALIKFNTDYLTEEIYEKEYAGVATGGSFNLESLVKEKKYLPFFENHMMEVFLPLNKGLWDWNTVQAVWRINQDFRPENEEKQWVIDAEFIKRLLEEAVSL
jgi:hypothetical protein